MAGTMAAMEDGIEDEEDDDDNEEESAKKKSNLNEDEEEFHEAIEAKADEEEADEEEEFDDEEEYAMGMMAAMEDDSEQEAQHEEQQRDPEVPRVETSTSTVAYLGQNILQTCSSLTSAVREYYRMSQNDQLQVWDDLTGYQGQKLVFVEGKELPGFSEQFEPKHVVEAALKRLAQELQRMPSSQPHAALELAMEKYPTYVLARKFLIKFLRAEKFDVFAAACRICRHFEIKQQLFGDEVLGRDITMDDLDEDDMDAMKSGYIQILQNKDNGNRPVIFYYKAVSSECYKERENILKAFWYMTNKLSESEEIQKLGVSNIVYNIGGFPRQGMDYEKSRRLSFAFKSIPVRYNNFFVCLDDSPWLTVVETFAVMITRFLRVRLRMIRGTHEEALEKLKAVGLPVQALPVNSNSELLCETHLEWIEKLRESERSGIRLEQARQNAPDVVEDSYEEYMQMARKISDSTAGVYGRELRRRVDVDVVPAEHD